MHNPLIAALDQDVRDGLAQFQALRDREEVVLAFGGGVFDEVVVGQLFRMDKHRSRDLDRVVESERANELWRSAVACAASRCASFARALTSMSAAERRKHVVEQRNLFVE